VVNNAELLLATNSYKRAREDRQLARPVPGERARAEPPRSTDTHWLPPRGCRAAPRAPYRERISDSKRDSPARTKNAPAREDESLGRSRTRMNTEILRCALNVR